MTSPTTRVASPPTEATSSATSRAADRRSRRALTLLELLIVLGLLVAIGALALPATVEMLERRRFEAAVDDVVAMLRRARLHARLEATAVEVVIEPGPSGRSGSDGSIRLLGRTPDLAAMQRGELEAGEPIAASWAELRLSLDAAFDDRPPDGPTTGDEAAPAPRILPAESDRATDALRPIAAFAPDGSAIMAVRLRLADRRGRSAVVVVDPWSGIASAERAERVAVRLAEATDRFLESDASAAEGGAPRSDEGSAAP